MQRSSFGFGLVLHALPLSIARRSIPERGVKTRLAARTSAP